LKKQEKQLSNQILTGLRPKNLPDKAGTILTLVTNIRNRKIKKLIRLFFSVELAPQTKTQLLTLQESFSELLASPVSPDKFHITLSYLGNTTENQLESILDNFESLATAPFEVSLESLVYWPKPAIIGLAVHDKENNLKQCKKQIEKQLSRLNFFSYDKKSFIPHITLFRNVEPVQNNNQVLEHSLLNGQLHIDRININPIQVEQVSLIESKTSQQGVHYQTIEEWSLLSSSVKHHLLGR
jgi:RNA 2',3'-cyclic 3'-phosphodiesterase